jgi:transposase
MLTKGGATTGRSPVDRGRTGSKHHLITDGTGIPLAFTLTGGNCNDVTQLIPLLEAVPPVRGTRSRPRRRPDVVLADRGYDHDKYRRLVRELGIRPLIARRNTEHGSGLGTQRWVVERAFASCTTSAVCGSAGRSATTCTKLSSASDARSSAGGRSRHCVRSSKPESTAAEFSTGWGGAGPVGGGLSAG